MHSKLIIAVLAVATNAILLSEEKKEYKIGTLPAENIEKF